MRRAGDLLLQHQAHAMPLTRTGEGDVQFILLLAHDQRRYVIQALALALPYQLLVEPDLQGPGQLVAGRCRRTIVFFQPL